MTVASIYDQARAAFAALGCGVTIRYQGVRATGIGQTTSVMRMDELGGAVRPVKTRRARFATADFRNFVPAVGDMIEVVDGGKIEYCEVMFSELGESGATLMLEWRLSL